MAVNQLTLFLPRLGMDDLMSGSGYPAPGLDGFSQSHSASGGYGNSYPSGGQPMGGAYPGGSGHMPPSYRSASTCLCVLCL